MATIIFDFDGTIADSFARVLEIGRKLADSVEPLPPAEIERLRGLSAYHVARELKIRPWKIPFLVARGRRRLHNEMAKIKAFAGMPAAIRQLSAAGHKLYIMSSNSVQNIEEFLVAHGMEKEFIRLYGGVGIFGKARVLKKIVRQNRLGRAQTFYVGDEVRDVQAARRAGVAIVAVAWGYNTAAALKAQQPRVLVERPAELVRFFAAET